MTSFESFSELSSIPPSDSILTNRQYSPSNQSNLEADNLKKKKKKNNNRTTLVPGDERMSALRPPTVRLRFRRRPINSTCFFFFFFFSSFTFGFSLQKRGLSISRIYEKKQKESLFRVITVDVLFLSLMDPTSSCL